MYQVFVTGGDPVKWATDDDLNLLRRCLSSFCEFTDLKNCDIIHSVNWTALRRIDPLHLAEKYVIAHIPHDVKNMLMRPDYLRILPFVNRWIVTSRRAKRMLDEVRLVGNYIPSPVDLEKFCRMDKQDPELERIRNEYNIPSDTYLIGSFQRDTEGIDLKTPKYIKGPDIFFEMIKRIYKLNKDICVILAGPRRFWLINQLSRETIPFIHVGKSVEKARIDDININTLPQEIINYLYNIIDLYVVTSRLEGGPKAITECAAAKCKILSTNVGQAADILTLGNVYSDPVEGIDLIIDDIKTNGLLHAVKTNYKKVIDEHTLEIVSMYWEQVYHELTSKKIRSKTFEKQLSSKQLKISLFDRLRNRFSKNGVITIIHTFHKPPWGGGNQFLIALKKTMENKGWKASTKLKSNTKICVLNSFLFDMNRFRNPMRDYNNICMIHRVDGPTFLVRGKDKDIDDEIFEINEMVADFTVFQSYWSYQKTVEMGYNPKRPVIIPNAVDPMIFNNKGRIPFSADRKIQLISTSWSSNLRKGFEIYKWIEKHLDWDRFEYTFVGNTPFEFDHIHQIPPQPSEVLARMLRNCDIYITASKSDPCSNALIEALACDLPALYLNDGGHPEIVGYGGLSFNTKGEILPQLDLLVKNYDLFQNLISIPTLDEITEKYLSLFRTWKVLKKNATL